MPHGVSKLVGRLVRRSVGHVLTATVEARNDTVRSYGIHHSKVCALEPPLLLHLLNFIETKQHKASAGNEHLEQIPSRMYPL